MIGNMYQVNSQKMNCLKITFFMILFPIITKFVSCSDYCNLEENYCNNKKHIGCSKNVFNASVKPWIIQPMTNKLRNFILNELNMYRSDIAMGKYANENLTFAANMRSMRWNNEFESLAELLIKKVPLHNYSYCADTDDFKMVAESQFSQDGNFNDETLFRYVFSQFTTKSKDRFSWVSRFFHASNYQFGCAFGNYSDDGVPKSIIKCIQNKYGVRTVGEAYQIGAPCSNCSMWNEVCSVRRYPGLCVPLNSTIDDEEVTEDKGPALPKIPGPIGPPIKIDDQTNMKGEKGDRGNNGLPGIPGKDGRIGFPGINGKGEKGDVGMPGLVGHPGFPGTAGVPGISAEMLSGSHIQNDFQYPISFWCLYSIMGIGVITSIYLSVKIIRNNYITSHKNYPIIDNMEFNAID